MIRPISSRSVKQHIWLLVTSASFAAMLATAPVGAGSDPQLAVKVTFNDLNLDQAAGVARLYQRLRVAARTVCGPDVAVGTRLLSREWRTCVASAVDRAVTEVDRPALTAYHLAHARGAAPVLAATVPTQR